MLGGCCLASAEEHLSLFPRNSATRKSMGESGSGVIWEQGKTPSPKPQSRLSINFILMPRSVAEASAFILSSHRAL